MWSWAACAVSETRQPPPLEVEASTGPLSTSLLLWVTSADETTVAAVCASDEDPADAHVAESTTPATAQGLRFQGLVPDTAYTCRVVRTPLLEAGGAPLPVRPSVVRHTTGPAEPPALVVDVPDPTRIAGAWTTLTWRPGCDGRGGTWAVVVDLEGRPRWWTKLPGGVGQGVETLWNPEGLLVWGGGQSLVGNVRFVDPWEGEVRAVDFPGVGELVFHHDGKELPDGRVLQLAWEDNVVGDRTFTGWVALLVDPDQGTIEADFHSQRYVDEGFLRLPAATVDEPYHANWLDWIEEEQGPALYVSHCGSEEILKLDGATGELRWVFGRRHGWTLRDADGAALTEDDLPDCQHGIEVEGDELLIYDNGQLRESRAGSWRLDPETRTATRTWSWTEPGWAEPFLGDIDRLDNGDVLLGQFAFGCDTGSVSRVTEVDPDDGEVVGRWSFPDATHSSYRAQRDDGCALFADARACPAVARRRAELERSFLRDTN